MKIYLPKPLTILICTTLAQMCAYAKTPPYCNLNNTHLSSENTEVDNSTDAPVYIEADSLNATYPKEGLFSGNVKIRQGARKLFADSAKIEQVIADDDTVEKRIIKAAGNVNYSDTQIQLSTTALSADLDAEYYEAGNSEYHFVDRLGRGKADKIISKRKQNSLMTKGSFTTCPDQDNSWSIKGSTINYNEEKEIAEIWNAVFSIGPVPIFYLPYFQYPTTNKRRSGFLLPEVSYGKTDGFEYTQPYYWNIAPNFDATLTTHYISKRGMRLSSEFRYLLNAKNSGTFAFDWLPNDRLYKKDQYRVDDNKNRWLFYWQQNSRFGNNLRFNVNATKVSDNRFFSDFNSRYGNSTDGYATQNMSVSYLDKHWDAKLSTTRFQVFDSQVRNVYQTQPKLDLNYNLKSTSPFNFKTYMQIARFKNLKDDQPTATRLHIEPQVSYIRTNSLGSVEAIAGVMATHYQQSIPSSYHSLQKLDPNVTRVLPFFTIDAKMAFEREMIWFDNYTQTLEPRIQYRYVEYNDQSNIKNYDSVMLQADYMGLFRTKAYGGYDRIASANQIVTGVTTRIYDDMLSERFNASVGQVYHLKKSRTGDVSSPFDKRQRQGVTTWAFDSYWHVNDLFNVSGSAQFDRRINSIALADVLLEYRESPEQLLQLNYRYASKEYISALDLNINTPYKKNISQMGMIGSWPITNRFVVLGAYYYDLNQKQSSDSFIGLQYNSCCWGIDITYGRKITAWDHHNHSSVYDNKLSFNITLQGLGSDTSNVRKILRSGIHPYQHLF